MKKYCSMFLLLLCGILYMIFALGSDEEPEKPEIKNIEPVKVAFTEQTIYNNHDVIIKVTGSEDTSLGTSIYFYIENNSNQNLSFNVHSYGVNGIMARKNKYDMRIEVAAGKKANTSLLIKNSILKEYNIDCIKYVDILFWIYDNDTMLKSFETNVIRIKSDKYDDSASRISGIEVYNKNGIKIDYLCSYQSNDIIIEYVVTNTTGNNLDVAFEGISINDYTVSDTDLALDDYSYDRQIFNNNQRVFMIDIRNDFKTKNNIQSVNKVGFYLSYTENDDYKTDKTDNVKHIINNDY